jgi:hypothetical protein
VRRGLVVARAKQESGRRARAGAAAATFLTFDEIAAFYRNPACARYYFPPPDAATAAAVDAAVARTGAAPICTDATDFYSPRGEGAG